MVVPKVVVKKKRKIHYKRLLVALLLIYFIIYMIFKIVNIPITNIYLENNYYLSDQEIIDIARVNNYPPVLTTFNGSIENKLENSVYIASAHVYKKNFSELHISIVENKPLFYDKNISKTILSNGKAVERKFTVATLINYVPVKIYSNLILEMAKLDNEVIKRISEIEYRPNDVDDQRFLLSMNDGNYVYININKFNSVNSYIEIIKKFGNKRGVLYLDSGEYFQVME